MPRVLEPISVAKIKGTVSQNPQRYTERLNAPQAQLGIGETPSYLTPEAKSVWSELEKLIPANVMTVADRIAYTIL